MSAHVVNDTVFNVRCFFCIITVTNILNIYLNIVFYSSLVLQTKGYHLPIDTYFVEWGVRMDICSKVH